MKNLKKIMAVLIAAVLVFAMGITVFGATVTKNPTDLTGPASITVTLPTITEGATANNTYKVYKVFDASTSTTEGAGISYKLVDGKTVPPAGFSVDNAGNVTLTRTTGDLNELTAEEIAAIQGYVNESMLVATVTTVTADTAFTVNSLPYGYYYITTTTGTVVTVDSTHPNAEVQDKNTVPGVDKKITGANSVDEDGKKALAQVGTTVSYTAEITVGKGAKGYVFHDTMEAGLTYNNDAAVTGATAGTTTYTVGQVGDDTFTITFNDDYIKTFEVGAKITITYSATVNEDAITTDPLNNTCYVSYGDTNSNNRTPDSSADVYEAKFTVFKNQPASASEEGAVLNEADGKYYKPLAGAGFVIKNSNNKYYKLTETTTGEGEDVVTTKAVTWVDSIDDATQYTSNASGEVTAFTGLADGTYTLVEKTVPAGFNKVDDSPFTIAAHDYRAENLEQSTVVTNNKGTELPSTGGIGTTIFYIIGGVIVLAAVIILVVRSKKSSAK